MTFVPLTKQHTSPSLPTAQLCFSAFEHRIYILVFTVLCKCDENTCISWSNMKLRWLLQIWMRQVRTRLWTMDDDDYHGNVHMTHRTENRPRKMEIKYQKIRYVMICRYSILVTLFDIYFPWWTMNRISKALSHTLSYERCMHIRGCEFELYFNWKMVSREIAVTEISLARNVVCTTQSAQKLLTIPRYDKVLFECEKSTLISLRFLTVVRSEKENSKKTISKVNIEQAYTKSEVTHGTFQHFSDTLNRLEIPEKRKWNNSDITLHIIIKSYTIEHSITAFQ